MMPFVPMRPIFEGTRVSSMCFTRYVVVVFPLVPVTPIIFISFEGSPKKAQDASARVSLQSFTRT